MKFSRPETTSVVTDVIEDGLVSINIFDVQKNKYTGNFKNEVNVSISYKDNDNNGLVDITGKKETLL